MIMKSYFYAILLAVFFCACDHPSVSAGELEQIAADFNKDGPRMVDSETRIDRIEIKAPNTVVYKYTLVNLEAKNVDTTQFKLALRPGLISVIKISPELKKLRDQHTSFEYYYQDKNSRFIYNFKISETDYK